MADAHPPAPLTLAQTLRRWPTLRRWVALLGLAALLALLAPLGGCGGAYQQHVERGQAALSSGRFEEALSAFEAAVILDPQGEEANQGLNAAKVKLFDAWSAEAVAALRAGDYMGALQRANGLQVKFPAEASRLVQEVGDASVARADHLLGTAQDPEGALALYDAIAERLPARTAQIEPKRQQAKRAVVALLSEQAKADAAAGRYPEAISRLDRALSLAVASERAPLDQQRLEAARAWAALLIQQAQDAAAHQDYADAIARLDRAHSLLPTAERAEVERLQRQTRRAWAEQHMRRAQDLRQQRRYPDAVAAADAAIALLVAPDDVAAISLRDAIRLDWANATEREALDAARAKDFAAAVALYNDAIDRAPDPDRAPFAARRLDLQRAWADDLIAEANALASQTRYADALNLLTQPRDLPDAERARLAVQAERTQRAWADALIINADALTRQGLTGAAFASAARAAEVAPAALRADYTSRREVARQALLDTAHVTVALRGATLSRDELDTLRAAIDRRRGAAALSVSPSATSSAAMTLDLSLDFSPPRFDERVTHEDKTATFQAGVIETNNPQQAVITQQLTAALDLQAQIQADLDAATQRLRDLEARAKLLSAHPKPPAPATPEDIRALLKQTQADIKAQERAVSALRVRLDQHGDTVKKLQAQQKKTPATLTEPQQGKLTYRVTTHTVRAQLTLTAACGDQRLSHTATRDASDSAHPPQPSLSLPGDPLDLPSQDQLTDALRAEALERVPDLVLGAFDTYRRALTTRASSARSDAERLHLLLLYALLNPQDTSAAYTLDLDRLSGLQDTLRLVTSR